MFLRALPLLSLMLAIGACQLVPPPAVERGPARPSARRPVETPSPEAEASKAAEPEAIATEAAEARAKPAVLQAPTTGHVTLKGTVSIDADYLLSTGRGSLISTGGLNLIAAGGGNIIGQAGSNLIGAGGGNLIAAGGGNIIGQAGSNLIGAGGGNYRLLDTAKLAFGEQLKAAEMEVRAYSLTTCEQLPLGVDDEGRPVTAIYSDGAGAFELYLPERVQGKNVRITSTVPGASDRRLIYELLWRAGATEAALIDEDTVVATAFVRATFVKNFERMFLDVEQGEAAREGGAADAVESLVDWLFGTSLPESLRPMATVALTKLSDASLEVRAGRMPAPERRAAAGRVVDALLSRVDLPSVRTKSGNGLALPTLTALIGRARAGSATAMRDHAAGAGPGHERDAFMHHALVTGANTRREAAGRPTFEIVRPADAFRFVLEEIVAEVDDTYKNDTDNVLEMMGLDIVRARLEIEDAAYGITQAVALPFLTDTAVADAAAAALKCEGRMR